MGAPYDSSQPPGRGNAAKDQLQDAAPEQSRRGSRRGKAVSSLQLKVDEEPAPPSREEKLAAAKLEMQRRARERLAEIQQSGRLSLPPSSRGGVPASTARPTTAEQVPPVPRPARESAAVRTDELCWDDVAMPPSSLHGGGELAVPASTEVPLAPSQQRDAGADASAESDEGLLVPTPSSLDRLELPSPTTPGPSGADEAAADQVDELPALSLGSSASGAAAWAVELPAPSSRGGDEDRQAGSSAATVPAASEARRQEDRTLPSKARIPSTRNPAAAFESRRPATESDAAPPRRNPAQAFESRRPEAAPEPGARSFRHPSTLFDSPRRDESDGGARRYVPSRDGAAEALEFFNQAVAAHLEQDYEAALIALETALALDPENRLYRLNRQRILKKLARSSSRDGEPE